MDSERCERCGMMIPKSMLQWHKCKGSDMRLRPANIPLERWIAAGGSLLGGLPKAPPPIPVSARELLQREHQKELTAKDKKLEAAAVQLAAKKFVLRYALIALPFVFLAGAVIGYLWK